ncbi:Uncharacterized protein HZ326_27327 [Fusarium oxysporum f. sp. albedinis]|nr:Uncharacterized protein HZ326_27327 [Fusarium oxysporum f. sp. albedinis]
MIIITTPPLKPRMQNHRPLITSDPRTHNGLEPAGKILALSVEQVLGPHVLGVLSTQDTNMLIKKWNVYSCNPVPDWITALISCLLRPDNTCKGD